MTSHTVPQGDAIARMARRLNRGWQSAPSIPASASAGTLAGADRSKAARATGESSRSFAAQLGRAVDRSRASASGGPAEAPRFVEYTVQPGDTLWDLGVKRFHVNLQDLIRDNGLSEPDLLQVGQKLEIRQRGPQPPAEVTASWYGEAYHGRAMANGERFDMHANTIAHKELPLGTRVELRNPRTGQVARAVITDRGPFIAGRDIDLSYGLAKRLSLIEAGVDTLVMRIL